MSVPGAEFQPVCPASVDRLPVYPPAQPPSRAQTVTNNLALVTAGSPASAAVKDTNIRGAGSMEGVETVRVTDMTSSSAFTKSIGSLFSTINKSVSSAFNSLIAAPSTSETATQPAVSAAPAATVTAAAGVHGGGEVVDSVALQHAQLGGRERPHQQHDLADWQRTQPLPYIEPAAYRGDGSPFHHIFIYFTNIVTLYRHVDYIHMIL